MTRFLAAILCVELTPLVRLRIRVFGLRVGEEFAMKNGVTGVKPDRAARVVINKLLLVVYLGFCVPGFSSSTGGVGKSVVASAPILIPHQAAGPIPNKQDRAAPVRQKPSTGPVGGRNKSAHKGATSGPATSKLASGSLGLGAKPAIGLLPLVLTQSGSGGSGYSVIATSLPAYYYTGNYYLAPWGSDMSTYCTFQLPCQTINGIQGKVSTTNPVVLLRGGIYFPTSGASAPAVNLMTAGASGAPIVYAAYPGETPIITGALPITGWQPATLSGQCDGGTSSTCYKATLPATITTNFEYLIYVPAGWPPSYLPYVMGRRSQAVSTPTGYLFNANTAGSSCAGSSTCINVNASDISVLCNSSASNCTGASTAPPYDPVDIRLYNFNLSTVDVLRVSSVNGTASPPVINFSGTPALPIPNGGRYLIVNSREYFLSNPAPTPGTFYLDCSGTGTCTSGVSGATIYYVAQAGENPQTDLVLAPQTKQLVTDLPPTLGLSSGYGYLTFEGLTFVGDNYVTPSGGGATGGYTGFEGQPNITAALSFVDTSNVTVDSSVIGHTSGWGLEFTNDYYTYPTVGCGCGVGGASTQNALTNSVLFDIGAPGLRLGRYPPDQANQKDTGNSIGNATQFTLVQNNLFSGIGRMYPGGEDGCMMINSSHDNTIQYNECVDSYGGGIEVGPNVGFVNDFEYNSTVQYNLFHDLGRGVIEDFGCVHFATGGGTANSTLGEMFQNNICHDIISAPGPYGSNSGVGIYIDNNSQYVTVKNNLVYRTSGALFFNNGSPACNSGSGPCTNLVTNNILAYSYAGAIRRGANRPGSNVGDTFPEFTFSNNIVYFDQLNLSNGVYQSNGPQFLEPTGRSFWTCYKLVGSAYPPPCTTYFPFSANNYWNPHLGQSDCSSNITFYTTDNAGSPLSLPFSTALGGWRNTAAQGAQEDIVSSGSSCLNPNFQNPGFPYDNYTCQSSGCGLSIGFNTFSLTAPGRNNPLIFPRPTATGFALQLISPYQF